MTTDKPQTTADKKIDTVVNLSLNMDADKAVKFIRGLLYKYNLDSRQLTVQFDGYNDDPREIWEIDRCVSVCQAVQDAGLFPHLTIDCAWLFYRIANRLFLTSKRAEDLGITSQEREQLRVAEQEKGMAADNLAVFTDADLDRFELLYRGIPEAIR